MSRRGQPSRPQGTQREAGFRRGTVSFADGHAVRFSAYYSHRHVHRLALLLGLIFLAAQFHFCADLSALNSSGHFCLFCSTAGAAVATHVPLLGLAPATVRLEVRLAEAAVSSEVAPSTSPRAPPAI